VTKSGNFNGPLCLVAGTKLNYSSDFESIGIIFLLAIKVRVIVVRIKRGVSLTGMGQCMYLHGIKFVKRWEEKCN